MAFILAYMSRHGFQSLYTDELYRNMAFAYTAVDFMVLIINRTMKNVLKRGFYKELVQTGRHVFLVAVVISAFLFPVQQAEAYSRITFFLTVGYYALLSYLARVARKKSS